MEYVRQLLGQIMYGIYEFSNFFGINSAAVCIILFTIIYLFVSFMTMQWQITWIIWIVYALVESIIKLLFTLRGEK